MTATQGASECTTQPAGGTLPGGLPLGVTGGLLFARTSAVGDATRPSSQRVSAEAGLGDLRVPLVPGLPGLPLPSGARVVKRFKPRRNGTFRVTLEGAKTRQVATFRFRTKVRFRVGNRHLFRTFTLPTYVDIG